MNKKCLTTSGLCMKKEYSSRMIFFCWSKIFLTTQKSRMKSNIFEIPENHEKAHCLSSNMYHFFSGEAISKEIASLIVGGKPKNQLKCIDINTNKHNLWRRRCETDRFFICEVSSRSNTAISKQQDGTGLKSEFCR